MGTVIAYVEGEGTEDKVDSGFGVVDEFTDVEVLAGGVYSFAVLFFFVVAVAHATHPF